jgi:uncharacterized membrane protein YhaH (DUF805 family)
MHWYFDVLRKYAVFTGRASRSEFWYFELFNLVVACVIGFVAGLALGIYAGASGTRLDASAPSAIASIYALAVLLPAIGVSIRRLHDIGKSGWLILVGLIPILGTIYLIVLYCQDSETGANKYGLNPKGVELAGGSVTQG